LPSEIRFAGLCYEITLAWMTRLAKGSQSSSHDFAAYWIIAYWIATREGAYESPF